MLGSKIADSDTEATVKRMNEELQELDCHKDAALAALDKKIEESLAEAAAIIKKKEEVVPTVWVVQEMQDMETIVYLRSLMTRDPIIVLGEHVGAELKQRLEHVAQLNGLTISRK